MMNTQSNKPTILFYAVGTVHIRNMKILVQALPDFHFCALLREMMPWFSTKAKRDVFGVDHFCVKEGRVDDRIFAGNISVIILSIAAVDVWVIDLMERAHNRGIPVIAIEEVHQLAVNDQTINNYVLPVDKLLVASLYERNEFIRRGHSGCCVKTTGWPFMSTPGKVQSPDSPRSIKSRLGISLDQKIAVLVLACINSIDDSSLENDDVRRFLMTLTHHGIPKNFQLVIKGHPNEPADSVKSFAHRFAPGALVLPQDFPIDEILTVANHVVTRGNTQVALECLFRKIPLCVVPFGIRTIFHDGFEAILCHDPKQIRQCIQTPVFPDSAFIKRHIPVGPKSALRRCAKAVEGIAENGPRGIRHQKLAELTLYRVFAGFIKDRDEINIQTDKGLNFSEKRALISLVQGRANQDDLFVLKNKYGDKSAYPYILALYIRRSRDGSHLRDAAGVGLFDGFPPKENARLFIKTAAILEGAL